METFAKNEKWLIAPQEIHHEDDVHEMSRDPADWAHMCDAFM